MNQDNYYKMEITNNNNFDLGFFGALLPAGVTSFSDPNALGAMVWPKLAPGATGSAEFRAGPLGMGPIKKADCGCNWITNCGGIGNEGG